jgi:hypothetical protein
VKLTTVLMAAGALLLSPALAPAQTGSIRGTVLGPRGEPVPDAQVAVDGVVAARTDAAGTFRIRDVPPAGNGLIVTAPGYADGSREVFIYPDVEASVTVRLQARSDTLVTGAGCACRAPGPGLSPDALLNAFVQQLAADLEAHAWRGLMAVGDPEHFRMQVTELGMGEAQYVAELFGLHDVDNDIGRGDRIRWEDLERIERVELHGLDGDGDTHILIGRVHLAGGGTLRLRASVVRAGGALRLTGASG